MYIFIYNDKEIIFDNTDINTPEINKNNEYELYVKNKLNHKLKEKFNISVEESTQYINQLKELNVNILEGENDTIRLNNFLKKVADANKKKILDNITNIYLKYYVENIDKKNAVVYNEFIKFNKVKEE